MSLQSPRSGIYWFSQHLEQLTASFLFNVPISLLTWMLLLGGVAAGSAADTLTGYNDRDIDAIMERTKNSDQYHQGGYLQGKP